MSENMAKIVKLLRENPERYFTLKEIGRELGLHYVTVWREMIRLDAEGLLHEEQVGFRYRTFKWK